METANPSPAQSALDAPTDQSLRVPCYCEENVWRLASRKMNENLDMDFYAVFVTNPAKCVPMFHQLASKDSEKPVFWDYHVILFGVSRETGRTTVFDVDSRLPYPCEFQEYLNQVFPPEIVWKDQFLPCFRVITASMYLQHFCSDRMHMYDEATKTWNATPPTYPCIQTKDGNNLQVYMTISEAEKHQNSKNSEDTPFGSVYTLRQLKQRFSSKE